MDDSSSSSDEETKQKLRLAVWDVKQSHRFFSNGGNESVGKSPNQSRVDKKPQPSLRASKSEMEFSEDYGAVKASPQLKSFVAKKLTTFLDGVIREHRSDSCQPSKEECADDFRLFSTSDPKNVVAAADELRKQRKKKVESSSDSDSEEERQKLASVAVSFEDVIRAQSILSAVEVSKPAEVITSNPSPLTSKNLKACTDANKVEAGNKLEGQQKKKKKKKRKADLDRDCNANHSTSELDSTASLTDKTSHKSCKRKHSLSSMIGEKTNDSVEDKSLQEDTLHKGANGDSQMKVDEDLIRRRKKKSKKGSDSLSSSHHLNDANLQQNESYSAKKRKKKKKSKES